MEFVKSSLINFCKGFGIWVLLLIFISVLGGVLLKIIPEDILTNRASERRAFDYGTTGYDSLNWRSRNFFNPFENYSYSPDNGINICKGIIRRTYSTVPTVTTRARIHQSIWQHFLGFCDVSFQNNYTGQQFGEDCLKNIPFRSAMKLMQMLS